jgi:glycine cleavage system transcriptional repressor
MAHRWIVTALGKDRPGIVAGVTKVLYRLGCNLEDSAMTRLEGEFTVMLIFLSPAKATFASLRKAFEPLERKLKLAVHLKPLTGQETHAHSTWAGAYLISVYGADRPGIVFRVSDMLARSGVNITDVHTHRSPAGRGHKEPSLYLLLLEVELPRGRSVSWLEQQLKRTAKRLGVEVSLRPSEPNIL